MDHLKWEAFLLSVDTGSFSAAAEKLGYTPSGITRMVNRLEAEMGFPLLTRSRRGVTLTREGEMLLPSIREMSRSYEQVRQISAEIRGLSVGTLTIGSYYSVSACWLPKIIQAFQQDYPGIRIHTVEGGNRDLLEWLMAKKVDCCFFSHCTTEGEWIPLKRDALVAWLPADHPKASFPAFPLKDLEGAPFITTLPGCNTDLERLLDREKITPDIRFTTADNYTTYTMVEAGLGISINNALMSENWSGNVAIVPFDPPCYITLGILIPSWKQASPAAKKFISYAKAMICSEEKPLEPNAVLL